MDGDRNIARQKELIAEMLSLGLDVSSHQATLANFEETQRLHVEHVRRLKQELVSASEAKGPPLERPHCLIAKIATAV
ncbi:MAG TPA: hypothetical protein VGG77_15390 [Roseiarcus sp.]